MFNLSDSQPAAKVDCIIKFHYSRNFSRFGSMAKMSSSLVLLSTLCLSVVCGLNVEPTEIYPYSDTLVQGAYIVYWKYNDTHITFETHVETLGWVGLGLSDNGNMYPADVIIGWVKNGHAFLQDRNALGYAEPEVDKHQDWHLLLGKETDDTTVLKFVRLLDTCDTMEDRPVTRDLTHLIFSWHNQDPDTYPRKHVKHGTKAVYLIDPISQKVAYPADAKVFDITSIKAKIPQRKTYYHCTAYVFPDHQTPYHSVAFEPLIEKENEDLVHHLLVKACPEPFKDLNGSSWECFSNESNCYMVYGGWAVGGKTAYMPENVGIPLGEAANRLYFILEVHYDNTGMHEGRVDNSGLRVIYTPTLRKYEAEALEVGVHFTPLHVIPPNYKSFASRGTCPGRCLRQGISDGIEEIHIFSVLLHTHLLGRKIILRHIRDGVELDPIVADNNYDFDFQLTRSLRTPRTVLPDDTLILDCFYDSTGRTRETRGGLDTQEEMCLAFIYYYPRMPKLGYCTSVPTYNAGQNLTNVYSETVKQLQKNDWNNALDRLRFQCQVDESDIMQICVGGNYLDRYFGRPAGIDKPYTAKSNCSKPNENMYTYVDKCHVGLSPQNRAAFHLVFAVSIIKLLAI